MSGVEQTAYLNGRFVPLSQATLSVADWGVISGVTLTETLRTFGGRLMFVEEHVARLRRGADRLGFPLREDDRLPQVIAEVAERNAGHGWPDVSVVVAATPGLSPAHSLGRDEGPTLCVHARPVPVASYADLYARGRDLVAFADMHGNPAGYPREVKHRSRLNWWLAGRECPPGAEPLFVDADGVVTETASGNVLLASGETLTLAPEGRVLPGVTQAVVAEAAEACGYRVERAAFDLARLSEAEAVLLSSSNYVLAKVASVDGHVCEAGSGHFGRLSAALVRRLGSDFVAQAATPR